MPPPASKPAKRSGARESAAPAGEPEAAAMPQPASKPAMPPPASKPAKRSKQEPSDVAGGAAHGAGRLYDPGLGCVMLAPSHSSSKGQAASGKQPRTAQSKAAAAKRSPSKAVIAKQPASASEGQAPPRRADISSSAGASSSGISACEAVVAAAVSEAMAAAGAISKSVAAATGVPANIVPGVAVRAVGEASSSNGGDSEAKQVARMRSREERLAHLQDKLDKMWPPFTDVNGEWRREFDAVIPTDGERYAGEGCARCKITGCDRCGMLFHLKNLMTHSAPRGGQPSRVSASRTHFAALTALLGYTPDPAPMPTNWKTRAKKGEPKKIKGKQAAGRHSSGALALQDPALCADLDGGGGGGGGGNGADDSVPVAIESGVVKSEAGPAPSHQQLSSKREQTPRNAESRNFGGHDGRCIHYRGMRLPFHNGQVVLVSRKIMSLNPARNVKFLGNLQGSRAEWATAFTEAKVRADAAGLVLSVFAQYDELHLHLPGGIDSNHCLHLFNHYRPPEKKMINKWETYMPIALHRTYDRLHRQPITITATQLESLEFSSLFEKLRDKELMHAELMPPAPAAGGSAGSASSSLVVGTVSGTVTTRGPAKSRCLVLVTRRWLAETSCEVGERVVSRYDDGREWYAGSVVGVRAQEVDSEMAFQYDVQYDDGDYEEDVPHERVLSTDNSAGRWEYLITGPEEASVTLPNDQQHPWWPNAEQFVDFVIVKATPKEVAKEVNAVRETAAQRYSHLANDKPYEKPYKREDATSSGGGSVDGVAAAAGSKGRQGSLTDGDVQALTADAEDRKVAEDLQQPEHHEELIYMFRKLAPLFLRLVDKDLRSAHLQPGDHDEAQPSPAALQAVEDRWLCAPVAEIAEGTRQKCDVCETSILDRHWACTVAGCEWEVCLMCHRQGERRRAARRERYERQQRGEKPILQPWSERPPPQPWYTTQSGRGSYLPDQTGMTAPRRPTSYIEGPREPPLPWLAKRNDYDGDEQSLQAKIDPVFPPVTNAGGHVWREFTALLPKEGKYAGQPCARCEVPGCTMQGRVFHQKNLATHGRPRGSGSKSAVYSRGHEAALQTFFGVFIPSKDSVSEVSEQILAAIEKGETLVVEPVAPPAAAPRPPKPAKSSSSGDGRSGSRDGAGAAVATEATELVEVAEEDGDGLAGGADERTRTRRKGSCLACSGKHRAHTCGKRVRPSPRSSKSRRRHKSISKSHRHAQRLVEEGRSFVGDDVLLEQQGRRKRQKRASSEPLMPSERQASSRAIQEAAAARAAQVRAAQAQAAASAAKAGEEEGEEEELGCFCDTDRHMPTNDIPFEGAWICCDLCSRWCHGECVGLTMKQAEALNDFVCPVCVANPPQPPASASGTQSGGEGAAVDEAAAAAAGEASEERSGEESSGEEGSGEEGSSEESGEEGSGEEGSGEEGSGEEGSGEEDAALPRHAFIGSTSEAEGEGARPLSRVGTEDGGALPLSEEDESGVISGAGEGEAAEGIALDDDDLDDEDDAFHMSRPANYSHDVFGRLGDDDDDDDDDDDGDGAGLSGEEAALSEDGLSALEGGRGGGGGGMGDSDAAEEGEEEEEEGEEEAEGEDEEEGEDDDDELLIGGATDELANGWDDGEAEGERVEVSPRNSAGSMELEREAPEEAALEVRCAGEAIENQGMGVTDASPKGEVSPKVEVRQPKAEARQEREPTPAMGVKDERKRAEAPSAAGMSEGALALGAAAQGATMAASLTERAMESAETDGAEMDGAEAEMGSGISGQMVRDMVAEMAAEMMACDDEQLASYAVRERAESAAVREQVAEAKQATARPLSAPPAASSSAAEAPLLDFDSRHAAKPTDEAAPPQPQLAPSQPRANPQPADARACSQSLAGSVQDTRFDFTLAARSCKFCRRGPGKCRNRGKPGHLPNIPRGALVAAEPLPTSAAGAANGAPSYAAMGAPAKAEGQLSASTTSTALIPANGSADAPANQMAESAALGPDAPAGSHLPGNLLRERAARRPGGTSIGVGEEVRVLRPGTLCDSIGIVVSARSGYYAVKFPTPTEGAGAGIPIANVFFRGKELWMTADGEPPPPEQRYFGPSPYQRMHSAVYSERPSWRDGLDATAPAASGEGSTSAGLEASGARPDGEPRWWWQSWVHAEGSRKRKPTQLYDAGDGSEAVANFGDVGYDPIRPRRRDRLESDHGLTAGCEILIMKAGPLDNLIGVVDSMHNGYYQVRIDDSHGDTGGLANGTVVNLRAKECQLLTPGAPRPPPRLAQLTCYKPPAIQGVKAGVKVGGAVRIRTYHRGRERRTTDIMVGHEVIVEREGVHAGDAGKVTAARNGYLIVALSHGKSAYFRAKDLSRVGGSADPDAGSTSAAPAERRARSGGGGRGGSKGGVWGGSGRGGDADGDADDSAAAGSRQRISWRDNVQSEVVVQEAPHEHIYERAVKMPQEHLAALVGRVESLLTQLPPDPAALQPPTRPVSFAGSSLRLLPSTDSAARLADFQQRWRRGEPVVIGGLQSQLQRRWGPKGFLQRFGAEQVCTCMHTHVHTCTCKHMHGTPSPRPRALPSRSR